MENNELIIGWVITASVAVVGWVIAIIQSVNNRKLQKTIEQKKMRHEAYRAFIKDMDSIAKDMSIDPWSNVKQMLNKYYSVVMNIDYKGDYEAELNQCLGEFFRELLNYVENATKPMTQITQAISAVELDATDELMPMLKELKSTVENMNNEWRAALSTCSQDQEGIQQLAAVGQSANWKRYQILYEEIVQQMRKECNI